MREYDNRKSFKTFWHRHKHQLLGLLILAGIVCIGWIGYRETHPKTPSYEEVLGIDTEAFDYEVTVEGFDGEMFIYSVYFDHDVTQGDTEKMNSRIEALYEDCGEDDYYGYIMVGDPDGSKCDIMLDLGNADDERMIGGILYALDGMDGIERVIINEGAGEY